MKTVHWILAVCAGVVLAVAGWRYWPLAASSVYWHTLTDKEALESLIRSYGVWAPVVFIGLQILQVILAPIPGEATGFFGGYVFGAPLGLLYSTIGLSIGSVINFYLGRLMGQAIVFRVVPAKQLEKLAYLVKPKAVLGLFMLFIFPGFPKDYLCLFLGLTTMRFPLFFWIAAVGRIPGTLLLSLQGASLMQQNYTMFVWLAVFCALLAVLTYRFKDALLRCIERYGQ